MSEKYWKLIRWYQKRGGLSLEQARKKVYEKYGLKKIVVKPSAEPRISKILPPIARPEVIVSKPKPVTKPPITKPPITKPPITKPPITKSVEYERYPRPVYPEYMKTKKFYDMLGLVVLGLMV